MSDPSTPDPGFRLIAPIPPGPLTREVGAFAARRRRSLERIIGPEDQRAELLATPIRADRICAALMDGRVVGAISFRLDGRGALWPQPQRFRARFGAISGTARLMATEITLRRGRARDLYIEGFSVAEAARGRGIGKALLNWVGDEVIRRDKAGWRAEVARGHDSARRLYEAAGARHIRDISTGPLARLLQIEHLSLYRWTPPARATISDGDPR